MKSPADGNGRSPLAFLDKARFTQYVDISKHMFTYINTYEIKTYDAGKSNERCRREPHERRHVSDAGGFIVRRLLSRVITEEQ